MGDGNGVSLLSQAPAYASECSHEYDGVLMPKIMPARCIESVKNFKVRDDDLFLTTYPKSGTTWVQQIVLLIHHDGDKSKLEGKHIFKMVPFIEAVEGMNKDNADTARMQSEIADEMPSPRILKTQLPPRWLPPSVYDGSKGKVIYIARNPKDMMVSYFHFCKMTVNLPTYESWDVFFEEFMADRVPRGSWFDSVLYWWKRKDDPLVLFIKFEEMKKDLKVAVKQISEFMGKSFSNETIEGIVESSTFDAMKKNKNSNPDSLPQLQANESQKKTFLRKGVVGDWMNFFSDEQSARFDAVYKEKMAGSGLDFVFQQE
ncbi:sulfotransferase 1C2-like [Lytechinus variegatus]|uniref:sulfotransferase 1C2-like n=1 Tax=Lytechinus variegatus TaxID=7654 RepID=UPI001BB28F41|nr:sulfotransferase 1C2-like [Lytechinus variegatus]